VEDAARLAEVWQLGVILVAATTLRVPQIRPAVAEFLAAVNPDFAPIPRIFNAGGTFRHGRRQIQSKTYDLNSEISYGINWARST
jgi:hypothetical protein